MSNDGAGSDFLSRERALLGDDANQFSTPQDSSVPSVNIQDGADDDDDLLGGGGQTNGNDLNQFQNSFPAIDTRNEVSSRTASGFMSRHRTPHSLNPG